MPLGRSCAIEADSGAAAALVAGAWWMGGVISLVCAWRIDLPPEPPKGPNKYRADRQDDERRAQCNDLDHLLAAVAEKQTDKGGPQHRADGPEPKQTLCPAHEAAPFMAPNSPKAKGNGV